MILNWLGTNEFWVYTTFVLNITYFLVSLNNYFLINGCLLQSILKIPEILVGSSEPV